MIGMPLPGDSPELMDVQPDAGIITPSTNPAGGLQGPQITGLSSVSPGDWESARRSSFQAAQSASQRLNRAAKPQQQPLSSSVSLLGAAAHTQAAQAQTQLQQAQAQAQLHAQVQLQLQAHAQAQAQAQAAQEQLQRMGKSVSEKAGEPHVSKAEKR